VTDFLKRLDGSLQAKADSWVCSQKVAFTAAGGVVRGTLRGEIEDIRFQQEGTLQSGQTGLFTFTPERYPQLKGIQHRIWRPWQMGSQEMHDLHLLTYSSPFKTPSI
jgi:hypothetical protein